VKKTYKLKEEIKMNVSKMSARSFSNFMHDINRKKGKDDMELFFGSTYYLSCDGLYVKENGYTKKI